MTIGVFDSGIGGLTVLKELMKYHPKQDYIYFGDTKNLPYGTKNKEELIKLASNIIEFFINKRVDIIFIACGTVSSTIYSDLKNKYNIPIVSIIDSTISYIKNNNIDNIAVLATPATIKSHIFKDKLGDISVEEVSCSNFVPIIEEKIDNKYKKLYIEQYLKGIKKQRIKNIILGCTHYPLIVEDIKHYLGDINCYNMGTILASSIYLKPDNYSLKVYFSEIYDGLNNKVEEILNSKVIIEEIDISR